MQVHLCRCLSRPLLESGQPLRLAHFTASLLMMNPVTGTLDCIRMSDACQLINDEPKGLSIPWSDLGFILSVVRLLAWLAYVCVSGGD